MRGRDGEQGRGQLWGRRGRHAASRPSGAGAGRRAVLNRRRRHHVSAGRIAGPARGTRLQSGVVFCKETVHTGRVAAGRSRLAASPPLRRDLIGKRGGAHDPAALLIGQREPNPTLIADPPARGGLGRRSATRHLHANGHDVAGAHSRPNQGVAAGTRAGARRRRAGRAAWAAGGQPRVAGGGGAPGTAADRPAARPAGVFDRGVPSSVDGAGPAAATATGGTGRPRSAGGGGDGMRGGCGGRQRPAVGGRHRPAGAVRGRRQRGGTRRRRRGSRRWPRPPSVSAGAPRQGGGRRRRIGGGGGDGGSGGRPAPPPPFPDSQRPRRRVLGRSGGPPPAPRVSGVSRGLRWQRRGAPRREARRATRRAASVVGGAATQRRRGAGRAPARPSPAVRGGRRAWRVAMPGQRPRRRQRRAVRPPPDLGTRQPRKRTRRSGGVASATPRGACAARRIQAWRRRCGWRVRRAARRWKEPEARSSPPPGARRPRRRARLLGGAVPLAPRRTGASGGGRWRRGVSQRCWARPRRRRRRRCQSAAPPVSVAAHPRGSSIFTWQWPPPRATASARGVGGQLPARSCAHV